MPNLNLPILEKLSTRKSILIAGMGGGFDIFCGLPLYYELGQLGKTVHLANYSFSLLAGIDDGIHLSQSVVGVKADHKSWYQYSPELYLTQWFREKHGEDLTIWCFQKTGVRPLLDSYQELIDHLKIDAILLIDGGVDSLLRGNEAAIGTLLEDSISLCAVNALKKVPVRLIACLGMGAEQDIPYAQIFENIAALTKSDSFLGTCSLLKSMEAYRYYQDAVSYVYDKPQQEPSVINASVISAVEGEFGNYHLTQKTRGSKLWISPLMPIYWFFDLKAVAKRNLLLPELRWTDTLSDAFRAMYSTLSTLPKRKSTKIQLG
jgi:hypothetical protein